MVPSQGWFGVPEGSHERTVLLRTLATPHPERKRGSRHGRATAPTPNNSSANIVVEESTGLVPGDVVHHQPVFRDLGDPHAAASAAAFTATAAGVVRAMDHPAVATDLARLIGDALTRVLATLPGGEHPPRACVVVGST